MHAAYTAPDGVNCDCPPAPCGGANVNDECAWHRDTANYWHAPEKCSDISRARQTTHETPRCDSTHEIPPLTFRCEEQRGHNRPHCTHTGGAEIKWPTRRTTGRTATAATPGGQSPTDRT